MSVQCKKKYKGINGNKKKKKRSFDSPIIQTFRLFLYLCVYINLPRFQKHVQNFQVSQFGCVVEASITVLLLKTNTD